MNQTQLKTILLLVAMVCCTPLFSQKDFKQREFSFHAGYGNILNGTPGLTLVTHSYQRKLAQGISWDGQYNYQPFKYFIVGFIYSGFSSKGSHPEGSDHLWINFIAPQIGGYIINNKQWQIRLTTGGGMLFYRNNSRVFDKRRTALAKGLGLLIDGSATYKLSPHIGVGMEIQYLFAGLPYLYSHYHGEKIRVTFDGENKGDLSRLNISAGISFYF